MKNAIYIRDFNIAKRTDLSKVQNLYFGNEFCENLIPDKGEVLALLKYVHKNGLTLTLLTPYCTDHGIEKLREILPLLPVRTEVVFSDWGVLELIKKYNLVPILGRLMISIKRDVRIKTTDLKNLDYFKTCNLESKDFQNFLIKNDIFRVELDNVVQGYKFKLHKKIKISLHYPFVYVSTSRKCITAYCADPLQTDCLPLSGCNFECTKYVFRASLADGETKLIFKGNSIFYKNEEVNKNIEELSADRLVYSPELPFYINEDILWNEYYKKHSDNAAWGAVNADNHVVDFVKYYNFFKKGAKILDSGCGHGKNSKYFIANDLVVHGIDISPQAIKYSKENNPVGEFSVHDVSILYKRDFFDVICDAGCLHSTHPGKHKKIIENYYTSLKKGGYMFIRIFKNDNNRDMKPLFYVDMLPVYGYTKEQVINLFDSNKFLIEKIIFNKDQGVEGIYYLYLKKL
ncbi:class I SAM-dependent methyltransferase [Candidatus Parcubacteria bacterium]|nr:class I SAM-dependent methyltransferase [Patescibacteria group bacterium]MBU4309589.1 class I SAM-dependent methyltransferase [Patescibacteria group bacterium]MBU4578023.1 class I SAM-dependent methyltransferase [Patescibacteria group bacterium]MCG2696469.1 class I SAM-dependent methyltransferase [Candidatus Parcubacteria bacterium]